MFQGRTDPLRSTPPTCDIYRSLSLQLRAPLNALPVRQEPRKRGMASIHGNHLLEGEGRVHTLLEGQRMRTVATALNENPRNPSEACGTGLQRCTQGGRCLGEPTRVWLTLYPRQNNLRRRRRQGSLRV